eukprot:6045307-Amphidinium_carterae.2
MWCMCLHGVPVDPAQQVPVATSPFDSICGELRKLDAPLDYDDLRARGLLCAPDGPTHTGIYSQAVSARSSGGLSHEATRPSEAGSLVSAEYDGVDQPALCVRSLVDEGYDSSSATLPDTPPCRTPVEHHIAENEEEESDELDMLENMVEDEDASLMSGYGSALDASQSSTSSTVSQQAGETADPTVQWRHGAGGEQRVKHASIANAAASTLLMDLKETPQGLLIEHRCVHRVLQTDSKAARAVFQSQSAAQRAEAFSASLHRAGLSAYAEDMAQAAQELKKREAEDVSVPVQADAVHDPYLDPLPARKRGRPRTQNVPASAVHRLQQEAAEKEGTAASLEQITRKVAHLEEWAHGVDRKLKVLIDGSITSVSDQNATLEVLCTRIKALETRANQTPRSGEANATGSNTHVTTSEHGSSAGLDSDPATIGSHDLRTIDTTAFEDLTDRLRALADKEENELDINWRLGMLEATVDTQDVLLRQQCHQTKSAEVIDQAKVLSLTTELNAIKEKNQRLEALLNTTWQGATATAARVHQLVPVVTQMMGQWRMANAQATAHASAQAAAQVQAQALMFNRATLPTMPSLPTTSAVPLPMPLFPAMGTGAAGLH